MRILYAMTAFPPSTGGAQTHLYEIARRVQEKHAVEVICHWSRNRTDWLRGVTVHAPEDKVYTIGGLPVRQLNLDPADRKKLALYTWSYYVTMGSSVSKISEALFKKIDREVGEIDLVHAGRIGREFLAWAALRLARKRKVPFVFTPFHHPKWAGYRYRWYLRLYCEADRVMALTQAEKKILSGLGVDEKKIIVIGHAPSLPASKPRPGYFGSGGPVVLFLGQKHPYKGIEQLLRSMALIWRQRPDVRFAYIGPRTPYSLRLFKSWNDTRVIEKDRVSEQEKVDALADCTVFCLPSRQESFGGVYAEAWMFRKPVIGGDIPAVSEIIRPGWNGELVDASPQMLTDKIIALLDQPERAARLGANGWATVQEKFNWEKIAESQAEVYETLMKNGTFQELKRV